MNNIHNFTSQQLCEYASIFPTVASLLDHLLFTIVNGYDFNKESGMITDERGMRIDEMPAMSVQAQAALVARCHAKERRWAEGFARDGKIDEEYLAANCARYKYISVTAARFTEDALYAELVKTQRAQEAERFGDRYHRPYPLSERCSEVYNLNANTPKWFTQIALNFCRAWVKFLDEELANNNVWIAPSLRKLPVKTEEQIALDASVDEMISEIVGSDTGKEYKEPQSDYGDLTWTTTHRNMLVEQVQRLEELLK